MIAEPRCAIRRIGAIGSLLACLGCSDVLGLDELVFDLDAGAAGTSGYSQTVLADQPLGYWRFNETAGTRAVDASGNDHDGAYSGVTLAAPGAIANDTAIGFDGQSSYCTFGDVFDFDGTQPFSLELWISPGPGIQGFSRALSKETYASGANDGWDLTVFLQSGKAYAKLERWVGGNVVCAAASSGFDTGVYAHIVASYGAGSTEISTNAQSSGINPCNDDLPLAQTTASFVAGKPANAADEYFQGNLDELAIYGRALGAAEISHHYQQGIGP